MHSPILRTLLIAASLLLACRLASAAPLLDFLPKEDLDDPQRYTTSHFLGDTKQDGRDSLDRALGGGSAAHELAGFGGRTAGHAVAYGRDHKAEIAGTGAGIATSVVVGVPVAAGVTALTDNPVLGGVVGGAVGGVAGGLVGSETKDAVKRWERTGSPLPRIDSPEDAATYGLARTRADAVPMIAGGLGGGVGGGVSGALSSAVGGVGGQLLGSAAGSGTSTALSGATRGGLSMLPV